MIIITADVYLNFSITNISCIYDNNLAPGYLKLIRETRNVPHYFQPIVKYPRKSIRDSVNT